MEATEVARSRRLAQVISSIVFCFFLAGIVFGFAALKPILLDSQVYSHLCQDGDRCKEQDTKLNTLFIVASSINNIGALPMGSYLDKVGPRAATLTGGLLCFLGCVTFSLGIVKPYFDTYLIGFALLGLSSPAIFLAQFHLSNTFPKHSGLILGAITGAFDASSLPVCIYKIAYFSMSGKPTLRTFFLCYATLPVLLIIQQLSFGPATLYIRPAPVQSPPTTSIPEFIDPFQSPHTSTGPQSPQAVRRNSSKPLVKPQLRSRRMSSTFSRVSYKVHDDADQEEVKNILSGKGDGLVGAMFGKSVGQQISSGWWIAMEFMVIIHMTRINWYLTTVSSQLVYYTNNTHLADVLTNAFIFLLPIGGLVSIPAIGHLLDARPVLDAVLVMSGMGVLFGVFTVLPGVIPQLIGIGTIVAFRPLFYTAMSDYAAKVFGFETFGTVYGLAMTLSGLFGFLLTPLDVLTKNQLHGSYTPVNVALLSLGLVSSLTLAWQVWRNTKSGRIRLTDEPVSDPDVIEEADES